MKQANSKHLDEAMHNTASHQGIHCLFERDTNKCQIIEKNQPDIQFYWTKHYSLKQLNKHRLKVYKWDIGKQ